MAQLRCLCGTTYSKTAKQLEAKVSCPNCGWSVETHEQERFFARAAEKDAKTAPEPDSEPETPEDAEDSDEEENGD